MDKRHTTEKLMTKVGGSKYTLVVAAAKRARQLTEGELPQVIHESNKPVLVALQEIGAGKVKWQGTAGGIK